MKKAILIAVICLQSAFAQEQVASFSTKYKGAPSHVTASYSVKNQKNNELVLLIFKKNTISASLLESNLKLKDIIYIDDIQGKYNQFIGGINTGEKYYTLLTNKQASEFVIVELDFKTLKSRHKTYSIKFINEKFIYSFIDSNGLFNIVTIQKNSSNLQFYELKLNGELNKKELNLNDSDFAYKNLTHSNFNPIKGAALSSLDIKTDVKNLFNNLFTSQSDNSLLLQTTKFPVMKLSMIDNSKQAELHTTAVLNKIYHKDGLLKITLDGDINKTTILTINPIDLTFSVKKIKKNELLKKSRTQSNSFLINDKLHQVIVSKDTLIYNIKNIEDDTLIKSFHVGKKDNLLFKNTSFQTQAINDKVSQSFDKTSRFLNKVSSENIGISVFRVSDKYKVVIGNCSIKTSPAGFNVLNGVSENISYSIDANVFKPIIDKASTWMESLFDHEFAHIKGIIEDNKFDRINQLKTFIKSGVIKVNPEGKGAKYTKGATINAENIFWYNDKLYFGFYQKRDKTYNIFEMKDK